MSRTERIGVTISASGLATAVLVEGGRLKCVEQRLVELPASSGSWHDINSILATLRTKSTAPHAELFLALERPLAHAKIIDMPRLRADDARQLLEHGCEAFFAIDRGQQTKAGVERMNRREVFATVAGTDLVAAAERTACEIGISLGGAAYAGLCAARGAIELAPWLRNGEWRLLIVLTSSVELVHLRGRRAIHLRSTPLHASDAANASEIARSALPLLGEPGDAAPQLCCAGATALFREVRDKLLELGFDTSAEIVGDMNGAALAAYGAALRHPLRSPVLTETAHRRLRKRRNVWSTALVASVLLVLALAASAHRNVLHGHLTSLHAQREALRPDVTRMLRARRAIDQMNARAYTIERLRADRPSAMQLLGRVSDGLPEDTRLSSFRLDKTGMQIHGWTRSATALVPVFEQQVWVQSVRLTASPRREITPAGPLDRFSLALVTALQVNDENLE